LEKLTADRSTNHVAQRLVFEMEGRGIVEQYRQTLIAIHRKKLETMLAAVAEYFPADVSWTKPHGGYFVWVALPKEMHGELLLNKALAEHVAFMPGSSFFANGSGENTMRLCFVDTRLELIPEGIKRLGRVITHAIAETNIVVLNHHKEEKNETHVSAD
jgi:2-aminoadipate transaminase